VLSRHLEPYEANIKVGAATSPAAEKRGEMAEAGDFLEGLVKSGTMILISEIGDKTFFIAAIMAMRHPRMTVSPAHVRRPYNVLHKPAIVSFAPLISLPASLSRPLTLSSIMFTIAGIRRCSRSSRRDDCALCRYGMGSPEPGECASPRRKSFARISQVGFSFVVVG